MSAPTTTTVTATTTTTAITQVSANALMAQFKVTTVPTGGSPTLDGYVQTSCDGGTTWQDIGSTTQFTNATGTLLMSISGLAAGATTTLAASDGALAANTVRQGPFGDQLRCKLKFSAGGSTGPYVVETSLSPKL